MTQNNIFRNIINIDCIEVVKTLNTLKKLIVLPNGFNSHRKQQFNFYASIEYVAGVK